MSRQGESMFYGASTFECSVQEALGNNEAIYYIGEFESTHQLILLDLRHFRQSISIFDIPRDDYYVVDFLQHFAHDISQVVNGNPDEYIPTQFITNYFRNTLMLYANNGQKYNIEGILYDSSKNEGAYNAVLFFDNTNSANHLKLVTYKTIDKWK